MKSVLLSIKPKYCELIASGKKTVEIRKNRLQIDVPFKVYMYQTKGRWIYKILEWLGLYQRKVIGEFVCNNIQWNNALNLWIAEDAEETLEETCLTKEDMYKYLGVKSGTSRNDKKYEFYGWHISDLVIYDKPKELSEFYKEDFDEVYSNWEDLFSIGVPTGCSVRYPPEPKKEDYTIQRPPQSWCYVEEMNDNG